MIKRTPRSKLSRKKFRKLAKHYKSLDPQKNGIAEVGTKTTVDNKLTHAAMLLSYMVEYGIDFKRRIISLTGEVDEFMYDILDFGMTEMESSSRKGITIKINSPGGSTYQAMAIVGRIKECNCHTISKGYGQVMSAATLILACAKKRKMSYYSFFLWHEASYDLSGRHSQNKADVKQVEKEEKLWAFWMAEFSKKDSKFWLEHGVGLDAYFTAEQLLKMGVVDELF